MLWCPSPERVASSNLGRFLREHGFERYEDAHRWSLAEPDAFWNAVWDFTGMVGDRGARTVERGPDTPFWRTRFFPDAMLNLAENLLPSAMADDAEAIVALDEAGTRRALTWGQLRTDAAACAAALTAEGVTAGGRVAIFAPNGIEAAVFMLGAAAIGAVVSSTSPDFGAAGVLDRFGQIDPLVLLGTDAYRYGGKEFDRREILGEVVANLPTLRRTVMVGDDFDAWLAPHRGTPLPLERRPFDAPWYVLYSSGTTGKPKAFVHRAGGVLLQHRKEHVLQSELNAGDRILYFTTTGWMMWNWLLSVLATGVTPILYDGNPFHPGPTALLDVVEREGVTLFGVSAKYLDALRKEGVVAGDRLATTTTICSTGSPLVADTAAWVYERFLPAGADVQLVSMSGGTDLCGCFCGGDATSPVYAGEIQRPNLGMGTDVFDDAGRSMRDRPGEAGELVCTAPFPSQPLGFWGDDAEQSRYRAAYFERFEGTWTHGDFAAWTDHGGFVITGRSDATLNPGGIRIGTAELYRIVENLPEVAEALVFGQPTPEGDDVRIVLAVRLAAGPGAPLDDDLKARIASEIRSGLTPRHVPRVIFAVDDLPRTRSGKLVELAVADAVAGRPVRNTEAIANPEALHAIAAHPALQW